MFAALTLERDPLTLSWDTLLSSLNAWTQIVGGFAMLGLVLWLVAYVASRGSPEGGNAIVRVLASSFIGVLAMLLLGPLGALLVFLVLLRRQARGGGGGMGTVHLAAPGPRRSAVTTVLFIGGFVWAVFGYLLLLASYLPELIRAVTAEGVPEPTPGWRRLLQAVLWTFAGGAAIFAVVVPILADLGQFSPRRIWAIARLSFKEAVRRKVLWVFLALLLIVLFASWFIPNKPEDQLRTYVQVVFLAMAIIILFLALLIAGFGIPDDIRQQTIHTVLTKPVQRFEIYLGRFLGYTLLMTAALIAVSGLALLYVLRSLNPEAREESLKARERLVGKLAFQGTKNADRGENVGREWDYRGYIIGKARGSTDPTQYAVWSYAEVPSALLDRPSTRMEFTLDIYRTHKGIEGQGIFCTFRVESWRFDADNSEMMKDYLARKEALRGDPDAPDKLAEEFGYYEVDAKEIQDFHTQYLDVPRGVFENARRPADDKDRKRVEELRRRRQWPIAPLRVRVQVDSASAAQFVGMAKGDLFFRLDPDDPSGGGNRLRFCVNFFKGGFGLWLRLCLVIGLAVALSTYLSGVISVMTTGILFVLGYFQDFIQELAWGRPAGGGPIEAAMRLLKRPGGESMAAPTDETASAQVATGIDSVFKWSLRRMMNLIPDVTNFSFTEYVAEGVAIPADQMAMSFLVLLGYLLPWAVLAYYLLKWREVASST